MQPAFVPSGEPHVDKWWELVVPCRRYV